MSLDHIKDPILSVLGEQVQFIVVFGSHGRGDSHQGSDIDIAIHSDISDSSERDRLRLRLLSILNGPEKTVDIVFIEDADWLLRFRIVRDGKIIFDSGNKWILFVETVLRIYPDYRLHEERFLQDALGGN